MVDISVKNFKKQMNKMFNKKHYNASVVGVSGTEIYGGFYSEEYLQKLADSEGVDAFDKMRRSDAQVRKLLKIIKDPIKSSAYNVEPVDDSDEEKEIAAFIDHVLMCDMSYPDGSKKKTFRNFISEALTYVEFGHSVFEVVHKTVKNHPRFGNYLGISELAYRHPRSILEWHLNDNGSINYIRQWVNGDLAADVKIPGEFLLVFSMEKEGDNYQGISMLRPVYGNYFRKDLYRKIQAIGIERAAKGVLLGLIPEGVKPSDPNYDTYRTDLLDMLNKVTSHEANSMVLGGGFDVKEIKITHDAEKVQKVIEGENNEMAGAFLANFMELGTGGNGGAYSLSNDLSDFFLSGAQCIVDDITEPLNNSIVPYLVKAKYGEREKYPKIKVVGLNDKAGKELAEVIKTLTDSGHIKPSDKLEAHLNKVYRLPDVEEDQDSDVDDQEPEQKPESNPDNIQDEKKLGECCGVSEFDKIYDEVKKKVESEVGLKFSDELLSTFDKILLDSKFHDAVSKNALLADVMPSVFIKRNAEPLAKEMRESLFSRSESMISKMMNIIKRDGVNGRSKALAVRMPDANAYKKFLKSYVGEIAIESTKAVMKELGKTDAKLSEEDLKKLPKKTRDRLLQDALLTASFQDLDLEKVIYFTFNENLDKFDSVDAIEKEVKGQRDRFISQQNIEVAAVNMTSKVVNGMRNDVFQIPEVANDIESFVFMNPNPKSPICQNLVGRVFSKEEYNTTPYLPPLHHNCKSFIRAQTTGKKGNKTIDPVGLDLVGSKEEIEKAKKSKTL